jgi:hypothetical protein
MSATAPDAERDDDRLAPHWQEAARWFVERLDDDMRKRSRGHVLPWERTVEVGQIDWWRVHSFALDRLDELLPIVLPDGELTEEGDWRGWHHEGEPWFVVNRYIGTWSEPASGKRGDDLVGLIARIYDVKPGRAAGKLARWLAIEAVRR